MDNIVRADLINFNAYSSARDEAKSGKIWLNANESPYDVELSNKTKINRYPEKQSADLSHKIAGLFKIKKNQLIISRGSDEVIDLLVRLCCTAGEDAILICPPTYGMYAVSARLQNAEIIQVPLLKSTDFQLDMESILNMKNKQNKNIKIIFLCSPNNPTGNLIKKEDIFSLCEAYAGKSLIVVDEAYIDYADAKSLAEYINKYKNLVILRTFSKAYGLAGARIGFLLANQEIIRWLLKIIAPYPLSAVIAEYVLNRLSDERLADIKNQINAIKAERLKLLTAIKNMPWVKRIWPSEANYLLIETQDAQKIMRTCAEQGVVIREMFDKPGLDHAIRITVGTPEQNTVLIKVLEGIT
ncbi:MAG TPA: histidinol-phosphate transaminase [Gammaproteobacteria bacterium]|nr:histidinol-phosphate transaminase [Gammaproteobacteria bacterium]